MTEENPTLADIYRMLEVVAFLLAVLVFQNGGTVGVLVGGATAFLLALNALLRTIENVDW